MSDLILNADDFGLTRGVNEGILRAHRDGVLTSTTLMANGPAFDDAVGRARANPKLGVGCHLVLVGGPAIAPTAQIPSIADKNGQLPKSLPILVAKVSSGTVPLKEIEQEFRAQIEKIRRAGIEPTHLDTHKHTHAHPRVMEALGRVARELGIKRVRRPIENFRDSWKTSRSDPASLSTQLVAAVAVRSVAPWFRAIARKYGLRSPDHFLGLATTGGISPMVLRHMIETLPEGQTEIMLHPGACDEDLSRTMSRLQRQRELELETLLDPALKGILAERCVRLITYRELD